jgi:Tfp pilus assembly protein FimV
VKFDLDLPNVDDLEPQFVPSMAPVTAAPSTAAEESKPDTPVAPQAQPARPTLDIPDISLDLDQPTKPNPFQVRMDLAEELWKLGQLHTSRALMEEVVSEAKGEVKARAKQWLAERG